MPASSRIQTYVLIPLVLLAGALLVLPGAADAATACFSWQCPSNGLGPCQFDSSCSSASTGSFIWKYRWNFGDGTSSGFVSSPTITHTYSQSTFNVPVTLDVWDFYNGVYTVTCLVKNREGAGNPLPYQAGSCSSSASAWLTPADEGEGEAPERAAE